MLDRERIREGRDSASEALMDFAFDNDPSGVAASAHQKIQRTNTQSAAIISGIVIAAVLIIGIFIVAQIDSALPFGNVVDDPANSSLYSAKNSSVSRIGDGVLLGSVVIIVLFASIILRVLRGL